MTLREFIIEASGEGPDSILWKKLAKKPENSEIVSEYERSPRKYALINKSTGEILEISNSSKISTAGYVNSEIEIGDDVIILNLTTNEIEEVEIKDSVFEASEDNIFKQFYRKYKNFDIENASEDELRKFVKEYGNITHKSSSVSALYSPKATRSAKKNARQSVNLSNSIESLLGDKYRKAREKMKD